MRLMLMLCIIYTFDALVCIRSSRVASYECAYSSAATCEDSGTCFAGEGSSQDSAHDNYLYSVHFRVRRIFFYERKLNVP